MSSIDPGAQPVTSDDPDQIRADIARTRANLSGDVDALTDTANPKNIARRETDKLKDRASGLVDKVMGSGSDTADTAADKGRQAQAAISGAAHDVGDAVASAPAAAKARTQGSPLVAGLIAFGVGLLVAGVIPTSQKEQRAAAELVERTEPLQDEAKQAVQQLGEQLQQPAQDAVEAVKESAVEAADTVKAEGTAAADEVRDQAQGSAERVQETRQ
ncbi:DUF3618 domain-containing protein [Parenemella sanctibonifatiensis]|uniref:DUF3618 domain-containing protein n=1 Tax=Parenemella sanctibonifatiensis TaxID=2016505 RepID=A0A255EHH1_9ACTN|nr:DUF3618 domain-containing protein [Parenemella sanctibonifatiensis]OYN90680.1 hypothetical protein CGZ92_00595 [Parenemella sanctibonifatiensis]